MAETLLTRDTKSIWHIKNLCYQLYQKRQFSSGLEQVQEKKYRKNDK